MKAYNEQLLQAKELKKILDKYLYLTDKIQNEVIHADTLMLYNKTIALLKEQCDNMSKTLMR